MPKLDNARPDYTRLVHVLMPALLEAGACLLRCRAVGVVSEEKGDGSPVSRADREAEAIVLAALARTEPSIPVIAEEAVAAGRIPPFDRAAFLVDALDGTKEYLMGSDDFTVNIALVEDGDPTFGMLLAPASGRVFVTLGAQEAAGGLVRPDQLRAEFRPILSRIETAEPDPRALRVMSSRSHRSPDTERFLARFAVSRDVRIGSSLKFGLMAAGEADIYPRFGPTSAWDIAAGHAILAAAGGTVTAPDGKSMKYLRKEEMARPEPFLNSSFIAWGRPSLVLTAG